jgi:hypothetical protein
VNSLSPVSRAGRASAEEASRPDAQWWFAALDQKPLSIGVERWLTQVVGVHLDGDDVWIQVQPLREQLRDFTIRVAPGMGVDDVLGTIVTLIREATRQPT